MYAIYDCCDCSYLSYNVAEFTYKHWTVDKIIHHQETDQNIVAGGKIVLFSTLKEARKVLKRISSQYQEKYGPRIDFEIHRMVKFTGLISKKIA